MANSIEWGDVLEIYLHTKWIDGDAATIHVATEDILRNLLAIDGSEKTTYEADISLLDPPEQVTLGASVSARVGRPKLSLGVLADSWDGVIGSPSGQVREPARFFVKEDQSYSAMTSPSPALVRYRGVLELVRLMESGALFLDLQKETLVYFKEARLEVPIRYEASDMPRLDSEGLESLRLALSGDVHLDQRQAILVDTIVSLARGQRAGERFLYLAQNAGELARGVMEGYRLFASSFSYSKIRGEVEAAQAEYVGRIHKTFSDIQGQLLGLPIAAVVVASQLKPTASCSAEGWANLAVVGGAWLFAVLLIVSCANQWFTLNAIGREIGRQKQRLTKDFDGIANLFLPAFRGLETRAYWHHFALFLICCVAIGGASFATFVFQRVTTVNLGTCLT